MAESRTPADTTPCPRCGVAPTTAAPVTGAVDDDDAVTHCEWCGAEYPVPHDHDHGTGAGDAGPTSPKAR